MDEKKSESLDKSIKDNGVIWQEMSDETVVGVKASYLREVDKIKHMLISREITLDALRDMVLGEEAKYRSDEALIRSVRHLLDEREERHMAADKFSRAHEMTSDGDEAKVSATDWYDFEVAFGIAKIRDVPYWKDEVDNESPYL